MVDFTPTDAAEVERELAELRHRIDESLHAIADLAKIRTQFAQLADTHRQYREAIANLDAMPLPASDPNALGAQDQRLSAIERELGSVALHVGDDIAQQMSLLRSEFDTRLQTLEQQAKERSKAVETLERTIRERLEVWLATQPSAEVTENLTNKVQRLASEYVVTRNSHRSLKQQVRILQIGCVVGGSLLGVLLILHAWGALQGNSTAVLPDIHTHFALSANTARDSHSPP